MHQAELRQEQEIIPTEDRQKRLLIQDLDPRLRNQTELCEMLRHLAEWKIIPAVPPRTPAQEPEIPA